MTNEPSSTPTRTPTTAPTTAPTPPPSRPPTAPAADGARTADATSDSPHRSGTHRATSDRPTSDRHTTDRSTRRRGRRRGLGAVAGVLALAALLGGCTLAENTQYRADIQPWGTAYVHIYQVPTFAIVLLNDARCSRNTACTVSWLRANVSVSGPAAWLWGTALDNTFELDNAISVARHSYDPQTGAIQCLMIYSVWTTGWGNSSDPDHCRHG